MGKTPCLLPPHALENRGGRGLAGGGLGPVVQGARVAGIVGKKEVEARGFDSPSNFGAWVLQGWARRPWSRRRSAAMGGASGGGSR